MSVESARKTVLVTGSVKGIGHAIALEAGRSGCNVVLHYRSSSQESVERALDELRQTGCRCIAVQADLGEASGPKALYEAAAGAFSKVDILVNNAALQHNVNFGRYTPAMLQRIFRVNLRGYLAMAQQVLPGMLERRWGRVVNISSVHAFRPTNFDFGYSATKGAIRMLTRELALLTHETGVTVNTVELGYVDVGVKSGNPPQIVSSEDMVLPRLFAFRERGKPEWVASPADVAPTVLFLASDKARFINGASLVLDGGVSLQ